MGCARQVGAPRAGWGLEEGGEVAYTTQRDLSHTASAAPASRLPQVDWLRVVLDEGEPLCCGHP